MHFEKDKQLCREAWQEKGKLVNINRLDSGKKSNYKTCEDMNLFIKTLIHKRIRFKTEEIHLKNEFRFILVLVTSQKNTLVLVFCNKFIF